MCKLCELFKNNNIQTKVYDRNDSMIVLDCKTCHTPMVIFREHDMILSPGDMLHAVKVLIGLFGNGIQIRFEQRQNLQHLHWHIILDD